MTPLEFALLGVTGLLSSALTALMGFGGGAFLLGVILLFMPPAAAIPFHGLVQLVSNGWRVYLFRRHLAWPLTLRFAVLLPLGIVVGLWFIEGLSAQAIQVMIGVFVLLSLFTRQLKTLRGKDLPLWAFWPLGFVMGILNMMVGVVAPLTGVLVVRRDLNKEQMIATMGAFALLGHIFKVIAFGWAGFSFEAYLPAFFVMLPCVLVGGLLGRWLLGFVNERIFMVAFQALLVVLALKLIVWEGIVRGW